jgi:hypothetical protein
MSALRITARDLSRIRESASNEPVRTQRNNKQDRLRELSNKRKEKWPNTLEAQRRMKYEQRRLREEQLEKDRLEVDRKEKEIQDKLRKKAIDNAKRLLFEQKDRIKELRSRELLSDVLLEQETQRKEKLKKKEYEKKRDAYFHRITMKKIQKGEVEDREKRLKRREKAKSFAKQQINQLAEYTQRHIERLIQDRIEGELVVEKSKRAVAEEREKVEARRRQARQNNMEMKQANERLKVVREKEAVTLALEEAKINEHARKRDEKEAMRRAHQKNRMENKRAAIQKMIDRATAYLAAMNDDANERLEQQVQAKRDADDEAARQKAAWRRKNWEACDRSRQAQIAAREEKKRIEKKKDIEMRDRWIAQCAALKEQERQERLDRRKRNVEVASYIVSQHEERKQKAIDARAAKLKYEKMELAKDKQEEKDFLEYLRKQVEDAVKLGKNVDAMKSVLKPKGLGQI